MSMAVTYTIFGGQIISDGIKQFISDPLGSLVAEVPDDFTGFTFEAEYWPYGESEIESGLTPVPFRFCGLLGYITEYLDQFYVRARFYLGKLGRWLNVDPLWPRQSAYAYCRSRPIQLNDPSGLASRTCVPWGLNDCSRDPCQWAIDSGKLRDETIGFVVCCNGKKTACSTYGITFPCASNAVDQCVYEHEDSHINDPEMFCGSDPGLLITTPNNMGATSRTECRAYMVDVQCLDRNCDGDNLMQECYEYLCDACVKLNNLCSIGRIAVPPSIVAICNKRCGSKWR